VPGLRGIDVFEWGGRNSARDRSIAADKLQDHIKSARVREPDSRHYIIAHSHGGNVALEAFAYNHNIDGIACLATPFIAFRPVDLIDEVREEAIAPIVSWALMGGVLLAWLSFWVFVQDIIWSLNLPIWVSALLGSLLALAFLYLLGDQGPSRHLSLRRTEETLEGLNLLIIRSPGDEAGGALTTTHFLSWVAGRLYRVASRWVYRPAQFVNRFCGAARTALGDSLSAGVVRTVGLVGAVLTGIGANYSHRVLVETLGLSPPFFLSPVPVGAWLSNVDPDSAFVHYGEMWSPVELVGACVFAYVLVVGGLFALFSMSVFLSGLPFGFWKHPLLPTYYVTAEPAPPGHWRVHELAPDDVGGQAALAHAEPYANPAAITILVKWLNETKGPRSTQAPDHAGRA
jgi:hypothetical protein